MELLYCISTTFIWLKFIFSQILHLLYWRQKLLFLLKMKLLLMMEKVRIENKMPSRYAYQMEQSRDLPFQSGQNEYRLSVMLQMFVPFYSRSFIVAIELYLCNDFLFKRFSCIILYVWSIQSLFFSTFHQEFFRHLLSHFLYLFSATIVILMNIVFISVFLLLIQLVYSHLQELLKKSYKD